MNLTHYPKIKKGLAAVGLVVVIWFPDLVWELFAELLHLVVEWILELLHILFEGLETGLDFVIEHALETDMRSTQIIVFYTIMAMIAGLVYGLFRWFRGNYPRWFEACRAAALSFRATVQQNFLLMPMAEKLSWLALVVLAVTARLLLGF